MGLARIAAVLVVAAVVAVPAAGAGVPGTKDVDTLLRGVPQQGPWLGKKSAPLILVEYVDLQCPYCAVFGARTFPTVVRDYVRTGRVRIIFRGLAFLGPDSTTALRWTFAAGAQNRLWNVLELLFVNQKAENSGWVTRSLLTSVARSVPGVDVARLRRDTARVGPQIRAAAAAAQVAKIPGTPSFQIGRSLMTLTSLKLTSFDPSDFTEQLDRALKLP